MPRISVLLTDADGIPVTRVMVPSADLRPDLVAWGARFFKWHGSGTYREAPVLQVFTESEHAAMGRD